MGHERDRLWISQGIETPPGSQLENVRVEWADSAVRPRPFADRKHVLCQAAPMNLASNSSGVMYPSAECSLSRL